MANDNVTTQIEEVLARAAVDDDFRKGLLTDPRTTLQAMADYVLPENLRVKFIEKSSDCDVLFVLPDPCIGGRAVGGRTRSGCWWHLPWRSGHDLGPHGRQHLEGSVAPPPGGGTGASRPQCIRSPPRCGPCVRGCRIPW